MTGTRPGFTTVTTTAAVVILHAAWSSTTLYNTGDEVLYNGRVWRALWYSRGDVPGDGKKNSPWQEWATGEDGNAIWTATRVFNAGDKAWYQGKLYVTQWYSRGDAPGGEEQPLEARLNDAA